MKIKDLKNLIDMVNKHNQNVLIELQFYGNKEKAKKEYITDISFNGIFEKDITIYCGEIEKEINIDDFINNEFFEWYHNRKRFKNNGGSKNEKIQQKHEFDQN